MVAGWVAEEEFAPVGSAGSGNRSLRSGSCAATVRSSFGCTRAANGIAVSTPEPQHRAVTR